MGKPTVHFVMIYFASGREVKLLGDDAASFAEQADDPEGPIIQIGEPESSSVRFFNISHIEEYNVNYKYD